MRQALAVATCTAALLAGAGTAAAQTAAPLDLSALGAGAAQQAPAVAFDGASHLVVWEEDARIWGAFLDPSGAVTGSRFVVTPAAEPNAVQATPAVAAASAGGFLVVWAEDVGAGFDVRAAFVDPGGTVLDPAGLDVSTVLVGGIPAPAPGPQQAPAVAAIGGEFLVVWQDGRVDPATPQVVGAMVQSDGSMPFPDGIAIAPSAHPQRSPSVATNGTDFLVAWEDVLPDGTADVAAARVSTAGAASPEMAISTAAADQLRPAVASNGGGYAIVWNDVRGGAWQLVAARVTDAGLLDPSGVVVAAVDAGAPHAIASDGIGYLVAYERSGAGALAARLGASGAPGAEVAIDAGAVAPGQALAFAWYGRYLEVHRESVAGVPQVGGTFVVTAERLDVAIEGNGSVASSPAGIDCGAACSQTYETGTSVTLTATPGTGFKVAGWAGCDSAAGTACTVTLTGPATVTATFVSALPGAPGVPTYGGIGETSLTASWTAAQDATGYELERAPDVGGTPGAYALVAAGTATSHQDTGLTPNATYWYRVRATNGAGAGAYGSASSVTTLTAAPGVPTFGAISTAGVTVSWTAPTGGAASYDLERATAAAGPWTAIATGLTVTSHSDAGLLSGTTYWYRVKASGGSAYSASASVVTLPAAPGTPTFANVTTTSATVSWTGVTGATGYKLERAPDDGAGAPGTWTQIAAPAGTTVPSTGLSPNTRYWHRVRATGASGDGPYSAAASVTTAPNAPGTPTFSAVMVTSVVVSWTAPAGGATSYDLERAASASGPWSAIATSLTATSHPDGALLPSTTYWYRVKANGAGGSAYSASASVLTRPDAPGTPSFASIGATSVQVSWTAVAGATGYKLERAPDAGGVPGTWTQIAAPSGTTAASGGLSANTRYWYRVRATNAGGDGPYSAAASVTTLPNGPGTPTFSAITTTSLVVSWTAPTGGAARYDVERATTATGPWTAIATGTTATSHADGALVAGTTYWYRVRAINADGLASAWSSASVPTLPGAPGTPTFASIGATSVQVSWAAAIGATGYKLERASDVAGVPGAWTQIATPTGATATSSGLSANTRYWYRVRATNPSGNGEYSAPASVTTLPNGPGTPTFSAVTTASLTVSWTAPTGGAASYDLERALVATGPWIRLATGTTSTSFGDAGLSPGTTYWYRVRATNADGLATAWSTASAPTLPDAPGTPTFANVGATSVEVSWAAPVGATGYKLERAPDDGAGAPGAWTELAPPTGTTATSTGLSANTVYWFRVRASNASGDGPYSAPASVTTLPAPPGKPTFTNVTTTSLTVSWTAPTGGAASYDLEWAPVATGPWSPLATGTAATSFDATGLTPGTTYWYRVRAANAVGARGAWSSFASVITLPVAPGEPWFTEISTVSLTVNWLSIAGATTYHVERAPDASGQPDAAAWFPVGIGLTDTYFNDAVDPGTYWYRVRAHNASGYGAYSPEVRVATLASAPGTPTFSNVTATTLTVSWVGSLDARYAVERSTSASGPWTRVAEGLAVLSYGDAGLSAGTTYWYRVGATSVGGTTYSWSAASTVTTALAPAPGAPTFANVTTTTLTVSWNAPGGGPWIYAVERATSLVGPWTRVASAVALLTHDDAGLTPSTMYWYRVGATSAGSTAYSWSTPSPATTLPPPPSAAPGAPTFSSLGASSVTVAWTAVSGATSYRLERAPDVAGIPGAWAEIHAGAATTYLDGGLAPNTRYWYRVRGSNAGGDGPYSAASSVVTLPGAPGAPTFANVATTTLTVVWTAPAGGADSYAVERATSASGPWTRVASALAVLSLDDAGLTAGTTYWYRVGATSAGATTWSWSPVSTVATLVSPPSAAPGAPTFSSVGPTSLTVAWTAASGATRYELERAPDVAGVPGAWTPIAAGSATTYLDSGLAPNTRYWYRVRGSNAGGDGPYSPAASAVTLPGPPGAPTFANVTTTTLTVGWTAPAGGAGSYAVERAASVIGPWTRVASALAVLSYADAGLAAGTTYWYRVGATGVGGTAWSWSPASTVATLPAPPSGAPGAPTFASVGTSTLTVAWTAAAGATTHELERAPDAAGAPGAWAEISAGTPTTYLDGGLAPNTRYWYRVRGSTAGGDGPFSSASSVVTLPNAPVWAVTAVSATSITLTWAAPAGGAASYDLERAAAATGPWTAVASGAATSHTDSGLTPGTTYWYRVRARNSAGGAGAYSAAWSIATLAPAPGGPTYANVAAASVKVSWTPADGAASYRLERAIAGGTFAQVAATLGTTYLDMALSPNTGYEYRVLALNGAGAPGPYSPPTPITTLAGAPGAPAFGSILAASVVVSWTAPAGGAASYDLERAPGTAGPWTTVAVAVPGLSHTDSGLAATTSYAYRVRARNSAGAPGVPSASRSVTTAASADTVPGTPGAPAFDSVRATAVRVSWASAANAAMYELERANAVAGPWARVATVALPGLTDTGRAANTTYWYRVRATNGAGASPYSPVAGVTTAPNAPAAPGFSAVSATSLTVTWAPPAGGAATYAVERASNAIGPWAQVARDLTGLSFVDGQVHGNAIYWYRIRASNVDGVAGIPSASASVTTPEDSTAAPPAAPAAPTFSNVAATSVWVSWATVPVATSYTLERAASSAGPWTVSAATQGTSSIALGLAANTTYWYRVRASNDGGDGSWSPAASVVTAPNAPGAPTFSGVSSISVTVGWTAPQGGAASYVLERAQAASGPWATVASGIAGTSRTDAGVSANTTYHYRVSAVNAAGVAGASSPSRSVTTPADVTPPPPAPGAPTYGTVTKSWIALSWGAAAGAVSYELERAPDGGSGPGAFALVASGIAGTSTTDTGRAANTRYWYRVRAVNAGGRGDPSEATSVTTAPAEPGAPTFQAVGTTSVDVSWTAPAGGAASYVLERAPDLSGPWVVIALGIPTLGHTDAGLSPSTAYWYRVRATNASGLSGVASPAASVTTMAEGVPLPGAPGALAFAFVRATSLAVGWDAAPDATAYVVERATASTGPWTLLGTVADTIVTDAGLIANTAYWYQVRGTNESGEGPASTARVVTAPNAPGAPAFANVGATTLRVSWTAPAGGATSYEVERATSSGGPWTPVGTGVTSLSFDDAGLTPATTWYYRVRALNVDGIAGAYSIPRSVVTAVAPGS